MALSLFSSEYFPEVLGFTLWLEVTSPPEHAPCAKILERYNLDPTFSLLHTAIDNMDNGHARYALDACISFVEQVKAESGEQAAEHTWYRIWRGYTAYGIVGDMYPDLLVRYKQIEMGSSPRQRFIDLIRRKAEFGAAQHGVVRLDGMLLDKLFDDPDKFEQMLADSKYVEPGNPWNSMFLNRLVTFHGPMYQVFNTDELNIVTDWIMSLKPSIEKRMYLLVSRKRFVGDRKHGNKTLPVLVPVASTSSSTSPTPTSSNLSQNQNQSSNSPTSQPKCPFAQMQSQSTATCPHQQQQQQKQHEGQAQAQQMQVEHIPIDSLFSDPIKMMQGLITAGYCSHDKTKQQTVDDCRLMRLITGGNRQMSMAFSADDVDTVREWIVAGCPVPEVAPKTVDIKSNAQFTHKL